jgi:uncharacterized protein (TIGR03435 family)
MKTVVPLVILFASFRCLAQSPAAQSSGPSPAFEVASVRLADAAGGPAGPPVQTSPDSLTLRNFSLRNCIQLAYEMPPTKVTGPDWLNDVRLDIVAKTSGPVDEKQLHMMLRTLLAERLGLKAHVESKEIPVYALTLAKSGPKFPESTSEGPPVFGRDKSGPNMQRVSMADLALALSQGFGRPFIDATGLKGRYDIRINMAPYMAAAAANGAQSSQMDEIGILITALQETLGLKVESRKDTVDIVIVDHVERAPTAN